MLLVVADSSPDRYLVQIGRIELLARLFEAIKLPSMVAEELRHPSAPAAVRAWMQDLPEWVGKLDPGERAAIALGLSLKADLILIDERKGTAVALAKGFEATGTLGVLDLAATRGLVNLREALDRLTRSNFRYRPELIAALLTKHRD
jgi:predicted nucleic acid-binding protein